MVISQNTQNLDLFGNPVKKPSSACGYASQNLGPDGERCKTCKHITRLHYSKVYLKCGLMKAHWTGGTKTDIRANHPACELWEGLEPGDESG